MRFEVFPVKAGRVGNVPPDSVYFALYAPAALGGIFTQANFTRVQRITLAPTDIRHVGHNHIGPALQGNDAPLRVQGFHGGSGGDINVRQEEAHKGHHFEG